MINEVRLFGLRVASFLLLLCVLSNRVSAEEFFPVDQLKPGITGETLTILQGSEVVPLKTEILGVQKNGLGPNRDLIIGKLTDERVKVIGVVHGMSGSPLYINGKLVGALSRRLGTFEKDNICGFTPIKDMMEILQKGNGVKEEKLPLPSVKKGGETTPQDLQSPLAVTGWQDFWKDCFPETYNQLSSSFIFTQAGGGGSNERKEYPLEKGGAVSALLMTGDIMTGATGTITWKDGNKMLAFGHPAFSLGATKIPISSAEIITILPSYSTPFKIANFGKPCGTMVQDRLSAVSMEIGDLPEMGTYHITRSNEDKKKPEWNGKFVLHPQVTPMLMGVLMANSIFDPQDASANYTFRINGKVTFKNAPEVKISNWYSGTMSDRAASIASEVARFQNLLSKFGDELEVKSCEMNVESYESKKFWKLKDFRVFPGKTRFEPVKIVYELVDEEGRTQEKKMEVNLPETLKEGQYFVRIVDGKFLNDFQYRICSQIRYEEPAELIREMNRLYDQDSFYLQIVSEDRGIYVRDRRQPSLPISIGMVFDTPTTATDSLVGLGEMIWLEQKIPVKGLAKGTKGIKLSL